MPRKNVRALAGKPMIHYAIAAGLACPHIDRVMITTDSPEIADVARAAGAEALFLRPADLSTDDARQEDAILHAMRWYEERDERFDLVCLLQPTEPLRRAETLNRGFALLAARPEASGVMSVAPARSAPSSVNTLRPDGTLRGFIDPAFRFAEQAGASGLVRAVGGRRNRAVERRARNRLFLRGHRARDGRRRGRGHRRGRTAGLHPGRTAYCGERDEHRGCRPLPVRRRSRAGPVIYLAILDGCSALRITWLALTGREVYLLDTTTELPGMRHALGWLARCLRATARLRSVDDLGPDAALAQLRRGVSPAANWYRPAEPVMLAPLAHARNKTSDPDYDYAAEKQATKHGFFYLGVVSFLETILANDRTRAMTVVGGDGVLEEIYRTVATVPPGLTFRPSRPWCRPVNLLISLVCAGSAITKVLSMFRLHALERKHVFMAIDVIDNPARLLLPVENTLEDPGTQALFVFRSRAAWKRLGPALRHYPCCPFGDGAFSGAGAVRALGRGLADALRLFRRYGTASPGLFLKIAKLNPARMGFEGLFNRYDVKFSGVGTSIIPNTSCGRRSSASAAARRSGS